jgi:DNA-binding transcriptional LysR family regulator
VTFPAYRFDDGRLDFVSQAGQATYSLTQHFDIMATPGRGPDGQPLALVKLFERLPSGYRLTDAGHALLEAAQPLKARLAEFEKRLASTDAGLAGAVRVSTSDGLATEMLPRWLAGFARQHAQIEVQVRVANTLADLSAREVDVVLRPARRLSGHMVGRKAAAIRYSLYASRDYIRRHGRLQGDRPDFAGHALIGYDSAIDFFSTAQWLAGAAAAVRIAARFDHLNAMLAAAQAGIGIAALPCFMAEGRLERLIEPPEAMTTGLWLLTHPELRRMPRIRAFLDYMADAARKDQARLAGETP